MTRKMLATTAAVVDRPTPVAPPLARNPTCAATSPMSRAKTKALSWAWSRSRNPTPSTSWFQNAGTERSR